MLQLNYGIAHFVHKEVVTGRDFKIMVLFRHKIFLCLQTVQTLLKCRIMWHFIWVFAVCQSTFMQVYSMKRVKY